MASPKRRRRAAAFKDDMTSQAAPPPAVPAAVTIHQHHRRKRRQVCSIRKSEPQSQPQNDSNVKSNPWTEIDKMQVGMGKGHSFISYKLKKAVQGLKSFPLTFSFMDFEKVLHKTLGPKSDAFPLKFYRKKQKKIRISGPHGSEIPV